ncbi:MAG TPA: TIGR02281 family clan AA aspartic protease [Beijerinckiaceae bacterium]|nr:TIGR02281 family clan AA aspartic protease [Beijerinckiaceae bacterium]
MSRPIAWAAGTLVAISLSATIAGTRLARQSGASDSDAEAASGAQKGTILTVSADLAGHFVLHPFVDGRRVRMLVDTGASVVTLSHQDAQALGTRVRPEHFTQRLATANGIIEAAPVRIAEIRVGDIVVRNVEAVVLPDGRLGTSLLGMSFLRRLGGFEISRGQLTLKG